MNRLGELNIAMHYKLLPKKWQEQQKPLVDALDQCIRAGMQRVEGQKWWPTLRDCTSVEKVDDAERDVDVKQCTGRKEESLMRMVFSCARASCLAQKQLLSLGSNESAMRHAITSPLFDDFLNQITRLTSVPLTVSWYVNAALLAHVDCFGVRR